MPSKSRKTTPRKAPASNKQTAKNKGGRPKITFNEQQYETLEGLCQMQATGEEIAAFFKIDYDTLNRILYDDGHGGFSDYFKKASGVGKISLRRAQFRSAVTNSNVTMQIFLGKNWLAQKDKPDPEDDIDVDDKLEVIEVIDPEPLGDEFGFGSEGSE